jgi:D-alanyl-lipoteichoic acid acyltransferase DltB (MBOAT superfamily)
VLFNTKVFVLVFLPGALVGYFLLGWCNRRLSLVWVLVCSWFFYAWWNPVFLLLLLASVLVNYGFGLVLQTTSSPGRWLTIGVMLNLASIAFFKYAGFALSIIGLSAPLGGIILPLGISFFTFQQIMYLVDLKRGDVPRSTFVEYACFVCFFPHLIAGPLVRPRDMLPQWQAVLPGQAWRERLAEGLELFLLGLAKKIILADSLAGFANPGFAAAADHAPISLLEAWVALLAFSLQIYFDFSGYSDMAIGLARMFGIRFPRNFNSPYKSRTVREFWRRWNITLGMFFRDYVYVPLGGSRRGWPRHAANLMTTMLLVGLWHGAAWRFVLWGALHGIYLVVHNLWRRLGRPLPGTAAWAVTLLCVLFAWIPFRAANAGACEDLLAGLVGMHGFYLPQYVIGALPWLGTIAHGVAVLPYLGSARSVSPPLAILLIGLGGFIALAMPDLHAMTPASRSIAMMASFALTLQALILAPDALPFLYFQF